MGLSKWSLVVILLVLLHYTLHITLDTNQKQKMKQN